MPPGPKPKPIEQKIREGNPGKRTLPQPVVLSLKAPAKPPGLGGAGSELWDQLVGALDSAGIVQEVDYAALTAMCVQWDVAEKARAVLASEGMFALGSMGQIVEHPAVKLMTRAHLLVVKIATEFGGTAAARARIAAAMADVGRAREEKELAEVIDLDDADVVELQELEAGV